MTCLPFNYFASTFGKLSRLATLVSPFTTVSMSLMDAQAGDRIGGSKHFTSQVTSSHVK